MDETLKHMSSENGRTQLQVDSTARLIISGLTQLILSLLVAFTPISDFHNTKNKHQTT